MHTDLKHHLDSTGVHLPPQLIAALNEVFLERDRYRAVLEAFPGMVSWVSSDLIYLGVNRHLADALGMEPAEVAGRPLGFADRATAFGKFIGEFLAGKAAEDRQVLEVYLDKGVEPRWYSVTARRYDGGSKAVIVGSDVTELRHVQDSIAALQRQVNAVARLATLGEVAAGMTHEINNPMTAIAGAAYQLNEALAEEPVPVAEARAYVELIEKAAKHVATIIDGARHVARGGSSDGPAAVSLRELVTDALALCGERLKASGAQARVDLASEFVVRGTAGELLQVLINLLSNACDAVAGTAAARWVSLAARPAGAGMVEIEVCDSGPEIPAEVRAKMMQPFFTTKPAGKGTGVGLSISRQLVERNGGRLGLDEASRRTRFVMTLPLVSAGS
jgi:C4-dicarboxylate-specific signal transduction histidine kinase